MSWRPPFDTSAKLRQQTPHAASFSHREEERLGEDSKTQEAAKAVVY
jgi:hypothetical protein